MRGRRAHVRCFGRRWYIEAFLSRCLSISAKSTESLGADSNRFPAHYECAVSGCRALRTIAIPAYLSRFLFSALRISLPQLSTHGSSVEEDSLSPSPRVITSASPAPASSAAPAPPRGRGSPPTATAGGRGAR